MSIYLENAKRVLAKAEEGIGTGRIDKPCAKCRYGAVDKFGFMNCKNPIVALAASQADDDYAMQRLSKCDTQRSINSIWGTVVCGPDAALFEEEVVPEVRRNVFQRLLDRLLDY